MIPTFRQDSPWRSSPSACGCRLAAFAVYLVAVVHQEALAQ